jgi:hypothetical protein
MNNFKPFSCEMFWLRTATPLPKLKLGWGMGSWSLGEIFVQGKKITMNTLPEFQKC